MGWCVEHNHEEIGVCKDCEKIFKEKYSVEIIKEDVINKPKCKKCSKTNFECKESREYCQKCWDEMSEYVCEVKNKEDIINKPKHYHQGSIDAIKFGWENFSSEEMNGFFKMNIIKYVSRSAKKGSELEDLKKAKNYLEMLIESVEND